MGFNCGNGTVLFHGANTTTFLERISDGPPLHVPVATALWIDSVRSMEMRKMWSHIYQVEYTSDYSTKHKQKEDCPIYSIKPQLPGVFSLWDGMVSV